MKTADMIDEVILNALKKHGFWAVNPEPEILFEGRVPLERVRVGYGKDTNETAYPIYFDGTISGFSSGMTDFLYDLDKTSPIYRDAQEVINDVRRETA